MLDYNPDNKLFLVKSVHVPNHVLEANAKRKDEQLAQKSQTESSTSIADKGQGTKTSIQETEEDGRSSGSEEEAGPASDGEQRASQPQLPELEVSFLLELHVIILLHGHNFQYTVLCRLAVH